MAKTRRIKTNKSPGRAFRNSKTFIAFHGDTVTTTGFRGRTTVTRVTDETGKRVKTVRVVADIVQTPAKGVGERKPKGIFVGRQYTGIARSKPYPYRSKKRGAVPLTPMGLIGKAARAVKRVVVKEGAL